MKWFKHYSSARSDEKLSALEDKSGIEGYGFYFKTLEVIAEIMNESDRCEVTYSISRWGRQLNITTKKFLYLSQCCSDVGLMSVCRDGDNITMSAPNLLKYRDNHTTNLQVTRKQEKEKEKEKEVEHKNISTKEIKTKAASFDLPDWIDKQIWDLWIQTRKGKKMIPAQMKAQVDKLDKWRQSGLDYAKALSDAATNGWQGLFEPKTSLRVIKSSQESFESKDYGKGVNAL